MDKLKKFLLYLEKEKNYSEYTIKNYKNDILNLLVFADNNKILIEQFAKKEIKLYLQELYDKDYKINSICRKISSIKSFFKFLENEKLIEYNYFSYVKIPKKEKILPVFLSKNEIFDLLNSINDKTLLGIRDRSIIEVLYSCGIRVSELINIKIYDVDFFSEIIKVFGKGKKERFVPIGLNSLKILKSYIDELKKVLPLKENDYLFRNHRGFKITDRSIRRIINKYILKISINKKISPHKIRHTFATHLLNEGCDLRSLQEMLGHKNLSTTEIYSHLDIKKLQKDYYTSHPSSLKNKKKIEEL